MSVIDWLFLGFVAAGCLGILATFKYWREDGRYVVTHPGNFIDGPMPDPSAPSAEAVLVELRRMAATEEANDIAGYGYERRMLGRWLYEAERAVAATAGADERRKRMSDNTGFTGLEAIALEQLRKGMPAAEAEIADLRAQLAALQRDADALRDVLRELEGYETAIDELPGGSHILRRMRAVLAAYDASVTETLTSDRKQALQKHQEAMGRRLAREGRR